MNKPKVTTEELIDFLVATPVSATAMDVQRNNTIGRVEPSDDAYTRLLHRLEPTNDTLWVEGKAEVCLNSGVLVPDDTVQDKPYARKMNLVNRLWSGKHPAVVKGIDLLTLLWTDGERHLPCDYRIYDKPNDGKTKNDHFGDLIDTAKERGFQPEYVLFDGWYSSLVNLKRIYVVGWRWLTRLKIISKHGTAEHCATNDLEMDDLERLRLAEMSWKIEEDHRGLKQVTNVEGCQCRKAQAQRFHIRMALRAFLVFERFRFRNGYNWGAAKARIFQEAVRAFRPNPWTGRLRATA